LLLVHEYPSLVDDTLARGACDFDIFFDVTSEPLVAAGIYHEIATALKAGRWRRAGLVLLAGKIAEVQGEASTLDEPLFEPSTHLRRLAPFHTRRRPLITDGGSELNEVASHPSAELDALVATPVMLSQLPPLQVLAQLGGSTRSLGHGSHGSPTSPVSRTSRRYEALEDGL
jgi:hypothetical protein